MTARALAAVAVVLLIGGCGGDDPVRIGVLTDCQGPFRGFEEAELSGAELPLLRRGATFRGTSPTDGLTPARIAGRTVVLVPGCAETGEHSVFIEEARRLVEIEQVDAIVGGASVVTREVARLYPEVPFVATFWDEPEITLRNPTANLYRFAIDSAQQAAGLGRYAYEELGWRRASVLAGDASPGWAGAAAFKAEFCALGGTVVDEVYRDWYRPQANVAERAVTGDPDGVAFLLTSFDGPSEVAADLLPRLRSPARQIILWAGVLEDMAFMSAHAPALAGVASTSWLPAGKPSDELRTYRAEYAKAFPAIPAGFGDSSFVLGYHDSVEALLQAFEAVEGDLSDGRRRLHEALRSLSVALPRGTVRLDGNRQAVTDLSLVRLTGSGVEPVSVARDVEQTFGGLLSKAPPPAQGSQPCRRATPPSWAR